MTNQSHTSSSSSQSTAYVNSQGAFASSSATTISSNGQTSTSQDFAFVPGGSSASASASASSSGQGVTTSAEAFAGDAEDLLLWRNPETGESYLWSMDGFERTSIHDITFDLGSSWMSAGVADFDGNGTLDILWQEQTTGELVISGIQNAAFSTTLSANPGTTWSVAATSDFDNDGKADILWRNAQTGENAIWLMNDQRQPSTSFLLSPVDGENWSIGGAGDFNGDGSDDIVWQDANSDVLTVWLMQDAQPTGEVLIIDAPEGSTWTVAGVSDFNTDGFADLLWRDTAGKTVIWLMQGNQLVGGGEVAGAFDNSWQIAV